MVLHDRGYQRWDGSRETSVPGARVIVEQGVTSSIAKLFKRKLGGLLLVLAAYGPFLFGLGVLAFTFYVRTNIERFPQAEQILQDDLVQGISPSPSTAWAYLFRLQSFFVFLLSLIIGMGLIAEDRRSNALELYLSRPLRVWQYVLGKLGVLAFFFAAVTVVPALLLILAEMSFVGFEATRSRELLDLAGRVVLACTLTGGVLAIMALAVSSLAKRARNAAVLWVGFWMVTAMILEPILEEATPGSSHFVSLAFHLQHLGAVILGTTEDYGGRGVVLGSEPLAPTLIVLGIVTFVSTVIVLRRVRPVEVVA
ncbi:MAG: hypothetical protein DHS20C15_10720 [Planctomycetota bacterium]|nr:MAG: hypothetical protein DHS20C15_10720 [Planctomycetota bacterium]